MIILLLACGSRAPGDSTDTARTRDEGMLLLSETGRSRVSWLDAATGEMLGSQCMAEIDPEHCPGGKDGSCLLFGVQHFAEDGEDRLMASWAWQNPDGRGAPATVAMFSPGRPPAERWRVEDLAFERYQPDYLDGACLAGSGWTGPCGLDMVHDAVEDPERGWLVVADTMNSRVLWLERDEAGGPSQVVAIVDSSHPDWDGEQYPNAVQAWREDGHDWLLVTFKSGDHPEVADHNAGCIDLWQVDDPDSAVLAWRYPEDGFLAAVHEARVVEIGGRRLMLYAHSLGAGGSFEDGSNGSVGIALFRGDRPPEYLGDGILPSGIDAMGFVREVEPWSGRSSLLVLDSGCESPDVPCDRPGQLIEVALPDWPEAGSGGSFSPAHDDQLLLPLEVLREGIATDLLYPFDVDLLPPEELAGTLPRGACP